MLEVLKIISDFVAKAAIIAPTMITDDMALVTTLMECALLVLHTKPRNTQLNLRE